MAGKQVGTILAAAREFHKDLGAFYNMLANQADKGRVKMLLSYFSHHQIALEESLKKYESTMAREVLETWYKYPPEAEGKCMMEDLTFSPGMSVDQVIAIAMRMDDCLMRLYRGASEDAPTDEIREVFRNLVRLMEREREHQREQGQAIEEL